MDNISSLNSGDGFRKIYLVGGTRTFCPLAYSERAIQSPTTSNKTSRISFTKHSHSNEEVSDKARIVKAISRR